MTESSFRPSKQLRTVPAMALDKLAHSAFIGAVYHLARIRDFVASPCLQTTWSEDTDLDETTKRKCQTDLNQFHWHTRAFFWELVASFDTMLQWANRRYGLGVCEHQVKWKRIPRKSSKDQAEWDVKYALLESAWNSEWFYETRMYRNFSHRGFLLVQGEYDDHLGKSKPTLRLIWLIPAREGQQEYVDLLQQLSQYLEHMRQLGEKVFA